MKLPIKFPMIKVPNKVTAFTLKLLMKTKKKSPEICLITGLAAGGAALIIVGVKTWKNKEKLSNDISEIKRYKDYNAENELKDNPEAVILSQEEVNANFRKACKTMGIDVAKTYWLPVILAFGSAGLIIGGHHILRKELSAMTSAYALLFDSYKRYREGVVERFGIEADQEIMHGVKVIDSVDPNTGEMIQKAVVDPNASHSRYARWFDEGNFDSSRSKWIWRNSSWRQNKVENIRNLKFIQSSANDTLKIRGWLKLNEVYSMLGIPCSVEGEHVGWVLGSGHDDFVDFGVFPFPGKKSRQLPVNRLFLDVGNPQNAALLDFNVDGCIDYIFDNILEYDSRSYISGEQRQLS